MIELFLEGEPDKDHVHICLDWILETYSDIKKKKKKKIKYRKSFIIQAVSGIASQICQAMWSKNKITEKKKEQPTKLAIEIDKKTR